MAPLGVDIAVVGGGLGGLALAVGLRRRGLDAHVFEAAPELRTATSTMIGLAKNAFQALGDLHPELPSRIQQRGAKVQTHTFISTPPGCPPHEEHMDATKGGPTDMYTIRWSEVQVALAELLPAEAVHCSHAAEGYTELPDGTVAVHFRGGPERDVVARCVVGADGINSAIRATMHPEDPGPRWLGQMNWNCILPSPVDPDTRGHGEGEIILISDGVYYEKEQTALGFIIDAGSGYTFWQLRVHHEEPSFSGGGGHAGMGLPGSKARVLQHLHQRGWHRMATLVEATPESSIYERCMLDRVPLERWVSPGGRVALLGDAAHAMHPMTGQGARSAFEDAHQLAAALQAFPSDIPAALQAYQRVRAPRAARLQCMAAESCGLRDIYERLRPKGLRKPEALVRSREFSRWVETFPARPLGDPDSTYWKPEPQHAGVEGLTLQP